MFPEKTNDKIFQKNAEKQFLAYFWAQFAKSWPKQNFPENSVLTRFFLFRLRIIVPNLKKKNN